MYSTQCPIHKRPRRQLDVRCDEEGNRDSCDGGTHEGRCEGRCGGVGFFHHRVKRGGRCAVLLGLGNFGGLCGRQEEGDTKRRAEDEARVRHMLSVRYGMPLGRVCYLAVSLFLSLSLYFSLSLCLCICISLSFSKHIYLPLFVRSRGTNTHRVALLLCIKLFTSYRRSASQYHRPGTSKGWGHKRFRFRC